MFVTAYQWKIKAGKEAQFVEAWTRLTQSIQGSVPKLSAKLHRTIEGGLVGIVEWPSQEIWQSQTSKTIDLSLQKALMDTVENVESLFAMETIKVVPSLS